MAKKNRFKKFMENVKDVVDDYKDLFKDTYSSLIDGSYGGVPPFEHLLSLIGTAGLIMGAMAFGGMGAIFPAVLFGFGAGVWATDEVAHLFKEESSMISRIFTTLVVGIVAPPLLLIGYPLVKAGVAIHEAIEDRRENRREEKTSQDYTVGYDKSAIINEPDAKITPTNVIPESTPIEELDIPSDTPTSDDSPIDDSGMES